MPEIVRRKATWEDADNWTVEKVGTVAARIEERDPGVEVFTGALELTMAKEHITQGVMAFEDHRGVVGAVAEGKFDGMITLRPTWEWDVAAGVLMVEEAGGVVSDRTGKNVQFNNPTPQAKGLIATTHTLRDQFLEMLDRR